MRIHLCLTLSIAFATIAVAQDDEAERSYPDGIAAIVEGEPITLHELELSCQLRNDYRQVPSSARRDEILLDELGELIRQRLLLRLAKEKGIEFTRDDQARLDWELGRRALDRRGIDGLKQDLAGIGVPYDYFVGRRKTNILVGKLVVSTISRDIFITPEEIRDFYAKNEDKFQRKGEVRLRQIVLYPDPRLAYRPAPEGIKDEVKAPGWDPRATLEAVRKRLLAGESFQKIAKACSMGVNFDSDEVYDSATRLEDVLAPPLGQRVKALKVGEVSGVIESSRGSFHLVLVTGRLLPGVLPLEEVQKEIMNAIKSRVWQERLDAWIAQIRNKAKVEVFLPRAGAQ